MIIFTFVIICLRAGGHETFGQNPRSKPKTFYDRAPANEIRAISVTELQEVLKGRKNSTDISIIRCRITQYVPCRGIKISLIKFNEVIATANSGEFGVVAFEGLQAGESYQAKVFSTRYSGSTMLKAGETVDLNVSN